MDTKLVQKFLPKIINNFNSKLFIFKYRDLDIILSKYEFWAHRLFPKMKFCDVVERLEKLGEKREVKVFKIIFLKVQNFLFITDILKSALYNIRLGLSAKSNNHLEENDPMVEDEMMTARVMDMMNKLDDDFEEDDENDNFDRVVGNQEKSNKKNVIINDDDDDDDDLIRNTNFESITQTNKSQYNVAI